MQFSPRGSRILCFLPQLGNRSHENQPLAAVGAANVLGFPQSLPQMGPEQLESEASEKPKQPAVSFGSEHKRVSAEGKDCVNASKPHTWLRTTEDSLSV